MMPRIFYRFISFLSQSLLGLIGTSITTSSAISFLVLLVLEAIFGFAHNPYFGILSFLILPMIFVAGLLLIPIGMFVDRKKKQLPLTWEVIHAKLNMNNPRVRAFAMIFVGLTGMNLMIIGLASYQGFHVMESTEFCGATCHTVMQPEFTAYKRSSHARVKCVECHIGAGADWFVKSKLSGSWQVVSVALKLYPRPIVGPIKNLRPARETCEQCHWPQKFIGDKLKIFSKFKEDEKNTETKTVLLMKIGGMEGVRSHGIHWHVDPKNKIRYLSDEKREKIFEVEFTDGDGKVKHFKGADQPEAGTQNKWRVFDCLDCHNRPSHNMKLPFEEVDAALQSGQISRSLPFVRREGLKLLKVEYPSQAVARKDIPVKLAEFYKQNYAEVSLKQKGDIETAGTVLADAYCKNIFPEMNVKWGTYVNYLGHENYPGCQRCHDGDHKTPEGKAISDDCDNCHTVLAQEEENPKILSDLKP